MKNKLLPYEFFFYSINYKSNLVKVYYFLLHRINTGYIKRDLPVICDSKGQLLKKNHLSNFVGSFVINPLIWGKPVKITILRHGITPGDLIFR